jgi:hypothetical protein
MHPRSTDGRVVTALTGVVVVAMTLTFTAAARAQTTDRPRLGVGVSFVPNDPLAVGVAGGVLLPIKDIGPRSIGVIVAGSLHRASADEVSFTAVTFGGGIRVTRTFSPTLKTFLQGALGGVQRRESDSEARTDFGFTVGGGFLRPLNERINFMVEADLGVIVDAIGGNNVGVVLTAGVSMPLGSP